MGVFWAVRDVQPIFLRYTISDIPAPSITRPTSTVGRVFLCPCQITETGLILATMILTDRMTFDAPKRTKEGYMAVRANSARAGVYDYMGYEVDPTGTKFQANDRVSVYRPADEVFDEKSVRSFLLKPITNDHPTEAVTSDNHSRLSKGVVAKAIRDGDHLAFDLVFFDAATIKDIESGKRELSNGYGVDLTFEDGVAPDGTAYQAVQRNIAGNHVALVDKGRAGPSCAIGVCDAITDANLNQILDNLGEHPMTLKPVTITIDGASHTVDLSDAAAILVGQLNTKLATLATDLATAQTAVGTHLATISTKDGEIAGLTQKLKDATAIDLDKMLADREAVVTAAKAIMPTLDAKGKTVEAVRKEAVTAKLGDAAKDMDDNAIRGAFAALTVTSDTDTLRDGITQIDRTQTNDARSGYLGRITRNVKAA